MQYGHENVHGSSVRVLCVIPCKAFDAGFAELGRCLTIDVNSIRVEEESRAKAAAAD